MIINKHITYSFDKNTSVNFIRDAGAYTIAVTNDSKSSENAICLFDKDLKPVKTILFRDVIIEQILVKSDENTVAVVSSEQGIMIIINLETGEQREFAIPGADDDHNNSLYPSVIYYWQDDEFIIYTVYEKIYRINMQTEEVCPLELQDIQNSLLHDYLLEAKKHAITYIVTAVPHEYQFAFRDVANQEIGFFDLRKGIRYVVPYVSNDVHEIYFHKDHLIVVSCYAIEIVNAEGLYTLYIQPKDRDEIRGSFFISAEGRIILLDRYWRKADYQMNLSLFHIEEQAHIFIPEEKEIWRLFKDIKVKDAREGAGACMRLALMQHYKDERLAGRWFDKLRLFGVSTTYSLLIMAYPKIDGPLYGVLMKYPAEDDCSDLRSAIELVKARYLKERGDISRYESALLKSIEYGDYQVNNNAMLGKLYLEQGRIDEGKQLIKRALDNVKLIYTDENKTLFDKYDIDEFLNVHYRGIYITQEKYNELSSLI